MKPWSHFNYNDSGPSAIIIATDGLDSFKYKKSEYLNYTHTLSDVTSFKNWTGEFLKRRMNKVMKENAEGVITPVDDIAMAVLVNEERL